MKRLFLPLLLLAITVSSFAQKFDISQVKGRMTFFLASDLGRNGHYEQKIVAETMGQYADDIYPNFIISSGDTHHYNGIRSVSDPIWMTNFELIYSHPGLLLTWHPILGNHEYRGNTQAMIEYSNVSRRWDMPDRYYTKTFSHNGTSVRIVWIDTTPLISKYHNNSEHPDIATQNVDKQLVWIDSVLTAAKEDWVVVVGHHPVYAQTDKGSIERDDMQKNLDPILRRHKVDVYACGHLHNFQHLRMKDTDTDYVVNSSGSLSRDVTPIKETKFCSSSTGFSIFSADKKHLNLYMIDKDGNLIYTITRSK